MKLIDKATVPAPVNTEFVDGHLYRRRTDVAGDHGAIYVAACGWLINLVTGNEVRHIDNTGANPALYYNVTDDYTLVHNSILQRSADR